MNDAWFENLIAFAPAKAGLEPSPENLTYLRDHLTLITIDECILGSLQDRHETVELRQYEELIASTDSLGDRMAFLAGWGGPADVAGMEERIHRQLGMVIDHARTEGRFFDPAQGDPRESMLRLLEMAARLKREGRR